MSAHSRGRWSPHQVLFDPLYPALTVGAVSGELRCGRIDWGRLFAWLLLIVVLHPGVTGLVGGGFGGIIISRNPALFATAAGLQCFGLGSAFWCSSI
jgi:hypothetical protein